MHPHVTNTCDCADRWLYNQHRVLVARDAKPKPGVAVPPDPPLARSQPEDWR